MGLQVAEKMEEQPYNTKGKKFVAIVNRGLLAPGWEIFSVFPLVEDFFVTCSVTQVGLTNRFSI
jgi:hypothetical protein